MLSSVPCPQTLLYGREELGGGMYNVCMSSSVIHFIGPPLSFLNKPALPQHYALYVVFVPAIRLDSCHLMWGKDHLTYCYGLGKTEEFTEVSG